MNLTKTMRYTLLGLLLASAAVPLVASASTDHAYYTPAEFKSANGEQVFRHICQGCHMPNAQGATGAGYYPALAKNPRLASARYMAAVVLFGRHDMPSFETIAAQKSGGFFIDRPELSDAQIAGVINYVRTHFGNHYTDKLTAADIAAMHP